MEKKIVNLDDQRKAVDITVGGKTFTIARVTGRVRDSIAQYQLKAIDLYSQTQEYINTIEKSVDPSLSFEENSKRLRDITEGFQDKSQAGQSVVNELLHVAIKAILDANNYEVDRDFWDNLDESLPIEFVKAVQDKDQPSEEVKKKVRR